MQVFLQRFLNSPKIMDTAQQTIYRQNYQAQWLVCVVAVLLFGLKIAAWYLTDSVAILTDALESIVNVISGFMGLYALYLSAQPKDRNHPYGHGKVEYISAAVEGTLILVAGGLILYEAVNNFFHPHPIKALDTGIYLISATALINYVLGFAIRRQGQKNHSVALEASGKHLMSDTFTTLALVLGLVLMYFTGWKQADSLLAIIFGLYIIHTGLGILRTSVAGMMDEQDEELLAEMIAKLNEQRLPDWIDMHNLRIIKYGRILHLDFHLTLPWYYNVQQAHDEVDKIEALIKQHYGNRIEMFVHTDACLDFSCRLCGITDCKVRKQAFERRIDWTVENVSNNARHRLD